MKRAFTLIEIMVSVSILSICLVLILQGFAQSLNALRISEDNLKATFVAENLMAEAQILAKEDWDDFAGGLSESFKFGDLRCEWELEVAPAQWQVELEDGTELPEEYALLNEVHAYLSWKEGKRTGRIPIATFMRSTEEEE